MPELPEVETIRRQLARAIVGAIIKDVVVNFSGRLNLSPKKFVKILKGKKFIGVDRRAKLLIFKLSSGFFVLAHLKMSGRFLITPTPAVARAMAGRPNPSLRRRWAMADTARVGGGSGISWFRFGKSRRRNERRVI